MKFSFAFFANACFIFHATSSEDYSLKPNLRIYNGNQALDGKYSFHAAIMVNSWFFCSGSILNEYWILTAAHCLSRGNISSLGVWLGSNNRGSEFNGQIYKVESIIAHENYNKNGQMEDDIGLIRLSSKIKFNRRVNKVFLNKKNEYDNNGTKAFFSGWGYTGINYPKDLHEITLEIQDHEKCKSFWNEVSDKQICTTHNKKGGLCHGDSGGPLILNSYQIGILSYYGECGGGGPEVFTRVNSYLDWIDMKIGNYTIK